MKFYENLFYTEHSVLRIVRKYKFDNDYGASVLEYFDFAKEKTMFEIVVLEFEENGIHKITYRTEITNDVLKVERKGLENVLERIKNLPDRKRIEIKKERIEEVKIYYFKFINGRYETVFEVRKFKNNKYKIASYGAGKDIEKLFIPFSEVKEFFKTIKAYKKEF